MVVCSAAAALTTKSLPARSNAWRCTWIWAPSRPHGQARSGLAWPAQPPRQRAGVAAQAVPDRPDDLPELLEADLERYRQKSASGQQQSASPSGKVGGAQGSEGGLASAREVIDKVMVADFFAVLLILAWLLAGVAESGLLHSSRLLDAWYPLWMPLFQPALGLLMAGALLSGAVGWLQSRAAGGSSQQDR